MPVAGRAEPVFQNERGEAVFVEPNRVAPSLVRRESAVAAAGADDDRGAGRFVRRGEKRGDRGLVGLRVAERAGGFVGPKQDRIEWRGVGGGDENEEGEEAHGEGMTNAG